MKVLLVEDSPKLSESLQTLFRKNGFVADVAGTLQVAKEAVRTYPYDLVMLDRMLPDGDGLDVIKFCREYSVLTRFMVLSALDQTSEKVKGLELGAEDYIAKPFEPEELVARVKVAVRRPISTQKREKTFGSLTWDLDSSNFSIGEQPFVPRRYEALILEVLMQNPGKVVRREALENSVYGYDRDIASNSLEAHISRLRKSLDEEQAGVQIKTVRGVGYVLAAG